MLLVSFDYWPLTNIRDYVFGPDAQPVWFCVGSHAYKRLNGYLPGQMLANVVVSRVHVFAVVVGYVSDHI